MEEEVETYLIEVKCTNCDWEGMVEIPKGTPIEEHPCPKCWVEALVKKEIKES